MADLAELRVLIGQMDRRLAEIRAHSDASRIPWIHDCDGYQSTKYGYERQIIELARALCDVPDPLTQGDWRAPHPGMAGGDPRNHAAVGMAERGKSNE